MNWSFVCIDKRHFLLQWLSVVAVASACIVGCSSDVTPLDPEPVTSSAVIKRATGLTKLLGHYTDTLQAIFYQRVEFNSDGTQNGTIVAAFGDSLGKAVAPTAITADGNAFIANKDNTLFTYNYVSKSAPPELLFTNYLGSTHKENITSLPPVAFTTLTPDDTLTIKEDNVIYYTNFTTQFGDYPPKAYIAAQLADLTSSALPKLTDDAKFGTDLGYVILDNELLGSKLMGSSVLLHVCRMQFHSVIVDGKKVGYYQETWQKIPVIVGP